MLHYFPQISIFSEIHIVSVDTFIAESDFEAFSFVHLKVGCVISEEDDSVVGAEVEVMLVFVEGGDDGIGVISHRDVVFVEE